VTVVCCPEPEISDPPAGHTGNGALVGGLCALMASGREGSNQYESPNDSDENKNGHNSDDSLLHVREAG